MPELPEVETVRLGLQALLPGRRISKVTYDWPKGFPNTSADVDSFLIDAKITSVERRAKVLMIHLSTDYSLVIHLKMTGQLVFVKKTSKSKVKSKKLKAENLEPAILNFQHESGETRFGAGHPNDSLIGALPDKSTRVTWTFADESQLFFNDQRKFGWVRLLPTVEIPNIDFFKRVGPEPLSTEFTPKVFRDRVRRRANTNIKAAILDQTVLAGIGNIYADEGLWAARIHPTTLVKNVSDTKLNNLHKALQRVLRLSIEKGGSSDRNYVNAEGGRGSYLTFAEVFRREGKPCSRCATIIEKTRVAGRGTHTCPVCQKVKL